MSEMKMGGGERLSVLMAAGTDIAAAASGTVPMQDRLAAAAGEECVVEITLLPAIPCRQLLEMLEAGGHNDVPDPEVVQSADVVLLSLEPELFSADPIGEFGVDARRLVQWVKHRSGPHLIWFSASSVEPGGAPHSYHDRAEGFSMRAMRANLEIARLSHDEGISIVDADRVLAEMGAAQNVRGPLDYSEDASEALAIETVRVLGEIGFFEPRPLVMQMGAGVLP